eukprot:m.144489 g.144489  ORF g.144489 m.144489 type:complete len:50 (-) comp13223_c0_seq8:1003-1152(-)
MLSCVAKFCDLIQSLLYDKGLANDRKCNLYVCRVAHFLQLLHQRLRECT